MKLARKPEARDIISLVCLLLLAGLFVWIALQYHRIYGEIQGGDLIETGENLQELVLSFGNGGILVVLLLHVVQVVVSVIPSAVVQFAGCMIFGLPLGMLLGILGVAAGTAVSFFLARVLGRRAVTLFVSEKSLSKLERLLNRDTSLLVLFFFYLIPFPKDIIAYIVGLSKMKASKLFLVSALGRIPGMFVAGYLGTHLFERNYPLLIGVTAGCSLVMLLAFLFRDKLTGLIGKKDG